MARAPADGPRGVAARAAEAARLTELHLAAEEERLVAVLAAGRHHEVVGEALVQARQQPWRESRWVTLALAQYRCGRQADALASIRLARRMLGQQPGLDPGSELADLERAILEQSPSLATDHEVRAASANCPSPGLASYEAEDIDTFFGVRTTRRRAWPGSLKVACWCWRAPRGAASLAWKTGLITALSFRAEARSSALRAPTRRAPSPRPGRAPPTRTPSSASTRPRRHLLPDGTKPWQCPGCRRWSTTWMPTDQ